MSSSLHVERIGQGPPLVLLHGYGASSATWIHWAPALAKDHEVHLVDLRGFGAAPKPRDAGYAPADLADDVLRMFQARDLTGATLVGHSLGGGVALLVALGLLDRGELGRVRRLVTVAGTAYRQHIPPYIDMLRHRPTELLLQLVPTGWLVRRILRSVVYDRASITEAQVERYAAPLRSRAAKHAAARCALQLIPHDLDRITARYPEIDVPTLILWGRQDPVVPLSVGERLASDLPRARLVVLEGCGHIPPEERPDEGLAVVQGFLSET